MRSLAVLTLALLAALSAAAAARGDVSIRRGPDGTPHIRAGSWEELGYGFARAHAEDNLCVLADAYVTVAGERSRFFGPDATYPIRNTETEPNNLNSDFFWARIAKERVVEKLVEQAPPDGPLPEVREGVRGYVRGYNDFIREEGGKVRDPACAGKPWVRPISEIDVYRRFYFLAVLASQNAALDGIGGAQPPTPAAPGPDGRAAERAAAALEPGEISRRFGELGVGSNAIALGRDATDNGKGLLLGNPHQPWQGAERFFQSHLTIPGKLDVAGGSLYGVPIVNIGHTKDLAWSHTVSTARRFAIYELQLVPGSPTTYLVDGKPREMKRTTVTVQARKADGSLEPRTRTLFATDQGPMVTSLVGLPLFPWTSGRAFAMFDANAGNFGRLLNHFLETNRAHSVGELDAILRRYQGIPWVNTIAADRNGDALYADIGAVPGIDDAKIAACSTAVGTALDTAQRIQVLDATRSSCDPTTEPGSPRPGIMPAARQPELIRRDYVENSNDSYWLSNPRKPLEGFPRIIGDERTERTLRTRLGLRLIEDELAGGGRFTQDELQAAAFNNRQFAGELWRPELDGLCRQTAGLPPETCDVLARWSGRDDLGAPGALLFRRFVERALEAGPSAYRVPFDPADPVGTPRGLNTENPVVRSALPGAVQDLRDAGVALDAPLEALQYETRGERIPLHGGPNLDGLFNVILTKFDPKRGYTDVIAGATYVQTVQFTDDRCPVRARTVLAHSQSTDPTSPWFANGTKAFSRKEWTEQPFCAADVKAGTTLEHRFGAAATAPRGRRARRKLLSRVRANRRRVRFRLARRARVTITLRRGGRVVRRVRVRVRRGRGTHVVRFRHAGRRPFRVRVTARAGKRRATVTRRVRVRAR
ncbi:MAG TPA: penicillin acylase family protein [Solirubrobacteraceae bacterium]|jgi:acyl-homoserine-lactone acylase